MSQRFRGTRVGLRKHFWALLFAANVLAIGAFTLAAPAWGWWLPEGASTISSRIDQLFAVILGLSTFFFLLTEGLLIAAMILWRRRAGVPARYVQGNPKLEWAWTLIPGILLAGLAFWQIELWAEIKYPARMSQNLLENPEDYLLLEVTTRQWEYRIRHPGLPRLEGWKQRDTIQRDYRERFPERWLDVSTVHELHTWKGQKTLVFLKTLDVGHSLFIPALRIKQDALPGRTIPLWFEPTASNTVRHHDTLRNHQEWLDGHDEAGNPSDERIWEIVCTQFCGSRHSLMLGRLFVHPDREDFLAWLASRAARDECPGPASPSNPPVK